jgi:hypothetical protein
MSSGDIKRIKSGP